MKIIYRSGSLFDHKGRYLMHGCNAQGRMNSGIAKEFRGRFPNNFEVYQRMCSEGTALGNLIVHRADNTDTVIINAITQANDERVEGVPDVSYDAVRKAMRAVSSNIMLPPTPEVAMPMIGAGLGGGDWSVISAIIEEEAINFQPVVYLNLKPGDALPNGVPLFQLEG